MTISVKATNVKLTKPLKDYATKKMEKLTKFFDHIQSVDVELHMDEVSNASKRQVVYVTAHASGVILRAEEASQDLYASLDLAFDNLGRQLKKYKEKMRDHKKDAAKRLAASADLLPVKRSKKATVGYSDDDLYVAKPMEAEEAARLLREKHLPFLVFRNFKNEKVNVVYPIVGTDSFGLIDPE